MDDRLSRADIQQERLKAQIHQFEADLNAQSTFKQARNSAVGVGTIGNSLSPHDPALVLKIDSFEKQVRVMNEKIGNMDKQQEHFSDAVEDMSKQIEQSHRYTAS